MFHPAGLPGELHNIDDVDKQQCLECIRKHPDKIVGVKIRVTAQLANNNREQEHEAYRY